MAKNTKLTKDVSLEQMQEIVSEIAESLATNMSMSLKVRRKTEESYQLTAQSDLTNKLPNESQSEIKNKLKPNKQSDYSGSMTMSFVAYYDANQQAVCECHDAGDFSLIGKKLKLIFIDTNTKIVMIILMLMGQKVDVTVRAIDAGNVVQDLFEVMSVDTIEADLFGKDLCQICPVSKIQALV